MSTVEIVLLAILNLIPLLLIAGAGRRILSVGNKHLYWVCFLVLVLPLVGASAYLEDMIFVVVASCLMVVPLFFFSQGDYATRLYFALLMAAITALTISLGNLFWQFTGTSPLALTSDVKLFVGYGVLCVVVQSLFIGLTTNSLEYARTRITHAYADRNVLYYCGYAAIQLFWVLLCIGMFESPVDPLVALVGNLFVVTLCLYANSVLLHSLGRFTQKAQQKHQAQVLSQELEHYVRQYCDVERKIEAVARVKHDIRNQTNILLLLLNQGQLQKATSFVCSLEEHVHSALLEVFSDNFEDLANDEHSAAISGEGSGTDAWFASESSSSAPHSSQSTFLSRYTEFTLWRIPLPVLVGQLSAAAFLMICAAWYDLGVGFVILILLLSVCTSFINSALREVNAVYDEEKLREERLRLLDDQRRARAMYQQSLKGDLRAAQEVSSFIMAKLGKVRILISQGQIEEACEVLRQSTDERLKESGFYCENRALNALLALKAHVCKEQGIRIVHSLDAGEVLPIADVDLCVLFSNLLDNAIHGCMEAPAERKRIEVKAGSAGGFFLVDIINGCASDKRDVPALDGTILPEKKPGMNLLPALKLPDNPQPPIFKHAAKDEGRSKELNRHGWGLAIIESLTDLYEGDFVTTQDETGWFRATASLACGRV